MYRSTWPCWLATLSLLAAGPARGEEKPTLKEALALQEALQQAIAEAEPSIACILVSRSDAYRRFGQGPSPDKPGELGTFSNAGDAPELKKLDLADPAAVPESFGSGVVIDRGLILTNYHVVRDATKVFVRLPGSKGSYADIHAADPRSDLAVLSLCDKRLVLKPIKLGDGEAIKKGRFVASLANPFAAGFRDGSPSASFGIISNVRRRAPANEREEERTRTLHHYGTLLQMDARLNLGCSGGALLDLKGELIGLTTALAALQGGETPGGFAVPMDAGIKRIIGQLKEGKEVNYGFLGVAPERDERLGEGVKIKDLSFNSPAARAGLQRGDVLLAVNGTRIRDADELFLAVGTQLAGSRVKIEYMRPARAPLTDTTLATLAKFYVPGKVIAARRPSFRGLRVDYTSLLVQQSPFTPLPYPREVPNGVLVCEVQPNTRAATALLKPGEVITHVNGRAVNSPDDFYEEVKGLTGAVELTLAPAHPGKPPLKVKIT
jgi:S1-C subfamily serine protease